MVFIFLLLCVLCSLVGCSSAFLVSSLVTIPWIRALGGRDRPKVSCEHRGSCKPEIGLVFLVMPRVRVRNRYSQACLRERLVHSSKTSTRTPGDHSMCMFGKKGKSSWYPLIEMFPSCQTGTYLFVQPFQRLIPLLTFLFVCLLHNSNRKEFLRHEC